MSRVGYGWVLVKEFVHFARHHKVWWIVPLVLVLAAVVGLVAVGQVSAPFIYTLF
jgi:hypothetical protein